MQRTHPSLTRYRQKPDFTQTLEGGGIDALTTDSPEGAELLFENHGCPDLMIIDLRRGEHEHGAQLADRLRHQYESVPVLIISGETASEALSTGQR